MSTYLIPEYKMENLTKEVNRLKNKGVDVTFNILDTNIVKEGRTTNNTRYCINCYRVEVEGKYIINGWRFIATIEHSSPENIIRLADYSFEGRVPEKYRTAPKECEHCHIRRDRNDTYLVYNEDADDWKQVGRVCLKGYTNGLDAETCASFVSLETTLRKIDNDVADGIFTRSGASEERGYINCYSIPSDYAKKVILKYIQQNGYTAHVTASVLYQLLFVNLQNRVIPDKASDEDVARITNFLPQLFKSDYTRNAIAAWNKEFIEGRDIALIASLCSITEKEIEKAEKLKASQTNVTAVEDEKQAGEKVSFTIKTIVVDHMRQPQAYYASEYPVYRIVDTNNNVYHWGCSNSNVTPKPGDVLEGTVKKYFTTKADERIMEVTRCKIKGHVEVEEIPTDIDVEDVDADTNANNIDNNKTDDVDADIENFFKKELGDETYNEIKNKTSNFDLDED